MKAVKKAVRSASTRVSLRLAAVSFCALFLVVAAACGPRSRENIKAASPEGTAPTARDLAVSSLVTVVAVPTQSAEGEHADWYVDAKGKNSNPCTVALPCATPEYAFDKKAAPGDIVQVAPGVYDYGMEPLTLNTSGKPGKYKTLTCATRGACKVQNSVTGNHTVVFLKGNYITFDGFEVTNNSLYGNNLGIYVTSTNDVRITGNTIHHIETDCGHNGGGGIQLAGSGIVAGMGTAMLIDSNLIYDISWSSCHFRASVQTDGILAETDAGGITITNNIVYHVAGGFGITTGNGIGNAPPMVLKNNTVFSNGNGGITIVGGTVPPVITNNIVVNNGLLKPQCGINMPEGLPGVIGHNYLWNNRGGNYCVEWGSSDQSVHADDVSVDPRLGTIFVDWKEDGSGDYHLKPGAVAAGRGSGRP